MSTFEVVQNEFKIENLYLNSTTYAKSNKFKKDLIKLDFAGVERKWRTPTMK